MRKNCFPARDPRLLDLHVLLMSAQVFSRCSGFLPHPRDVCVRFIGMSQLSQSECRIGCDRRASCPGWVPTLHPELPEEALTTQDPELE